MNYLSIDQLKTGELYLFRRIFSSKSISLQPARLLEIRATADRPVVVVKWVLDDVETSVNVGDGTKAAVKLSKSWLERQMNDRTAQVAALQAENSRLFTIFKAFA